jgi:tetraacyldisaccharide 4'-kinase
MPNDSPDRSGIVDTIWNGDSSAAIAARAALTPVAWAYAAVVGAKNILYDAGWLHARAAALPTLSVGNLTVGGTGKTPVAAWLAGLFIAEGRRPAIVHRGYGGDEPEVHRRLNPGIIVIASPDRAEAISRAQREGADVAILDDAFQHRRVARQTDLVLVSADRFSERKRLLPAGPWRESLESLRRATLVAVTGKVAGDAAVEAVHEAIAAAAPGVPRVSLRLEPDALVDVHSGERRPLSALMGTAAHVITAIGDPSSFTGQLEQAGATVVARTYRDHHQFKTSDVAAFVAEIPGSAVAICTLKDAVKLAPLWPRGGPGLWYVSQRVTVERGVGGIDRLVSSTLRGHKQSDA